jgi:hypothetical protein
MPSLPFRLLTTAIFAVLAATPVFGDEVASQASAPDASSQSLWLISTRQAPRCTYTKAGVSDICYWQLNNDSHDWVSCDAQQFHVQSDPAIPTVIFIHGSQTQADAAVEYGLCAYRALQQAAEGRPFRCEIWSWPSDREYLRPRPDTLQKLAYCTTQSQYLADRIAALNSESPLCLIGYSFGARIIGDALQILASGKSVDDDSSTEEHVGKAPKNLRVMLLAAAMDHNVFLARHRDGEAISLIGQLLVTINPCDRILRWYPRLRGRFGPDAMGFVGPLVNKDANNVERVNVSRSVGRLHEIQRYLASDEFRSRLSKYAFFVDESPAAAQSSPDAKTEEAEPGKP